jgi:hypothetical protein
MAEHWQLRLQSSEIDNIRLHRNESHFVACLEDWKSKQRGSYEQALKAIMLLWLQISEGSERISATDF